VCAISLKNAYAKRPLRRDLPDADTSGVQVSSRPVSSPSSVQLSGSLVRIRLSGRLVSSPSGVQLSGVRPFALLHPSRPRQRVVAMGTRRYGGATVTTGTSRVPCGPAPVPPAARSTVRVSLDVGNAAEVVYRPARERRPRPCPGGAWAGRLLPTDQGGQTAAGVPRRWRRGSGRESWVKRDVPALRVAASLAWSCDYAPWSLWSLTPEWTGPEGHELDGEDGRTAPARPSQVAGPPSSTPTAL
jgi:hypothetical protein